MSCSTCVDSCTCVVDGVSPIVISGTGSGADPLVVSFSGLCETVQDCVQDTLNTQGFVYNDGSARFDNAAASGTVLASDGLTGATFVSLATPSCEDVQDCIGGMLDTQGFSYSDSSAVFVNAGDSQSVLTSDGAGNAEFMPRGRKAADGRLTLVSGDPVPTTATGDTLYYTPYVGNKISLFNGIGWVKYAFTEMSITPIHAGAKVADVYMWADSVGTLSLEMHDWSTDTVRGSAADIVLLNGIWVLSSDHTRRLLGTAHCQKTSVSTGEGMRDDVLHRLVWNVNNRILRQMQALVGTASWSYSGAGVWRMTNNSGVVQLQILAGIVEDAVVADAKTQFSESAVSQTGYVGIGLDSVTTPIISAIGGGWTGPASTAGNAGASVRWDGYVGLGKHYLQQLETTSQASAVTFIGGSTYNTAITAEVFA